jgi:hypothetical protein
LLILSKKSLKANLGILSSVKKMPSDAEETQFIQAMNALEEFVKILIKEYPLVFKDGSGGIKIGPSVQKPFFPYEASLEIKKKK